MKQEPVIRVGIIEASRVRYIYKGVEHVVNYSPDFEEVYLPEGPFTLRDVTIGKQFHWEQQEDQTFVGALRIIALPHPKGLLVAINEVPIEDYLASVISSEMAATNNLELLKTHAIISRSWVLRQIDRLSADPVSEITSPLKEADDHRHTGNEGEEAWIKFWDHDDHAFYDVCADDHCQRYQGITRQVSPLVAEAIRQTRGQVLTLPSEDGQGCRICDARFYKACGGHTERFSACWQDRDYPYLEPTPDPYCAPAFIAGLPGGMEGVMRQVLNSYDQSTIDYHEWTEHYTVPDLTALVERKLSEVFPERVPWHLGRITALEPLERGASGRIVRLRIVGTEGTVTIGKELLVRKVLSESHLKSSWFDVEWTGEDVTLHGHGWGHGVGLCQIGAAAMSIAGFSCAEILAHYFHHAEIRRIY